MEVKTAKVFRYNQIFMCLGWLTVRDGYTLVVGIEINDGWCGDLQQTAFFLFIYLGIGKEFECEKII